MNTAEYAVVHGIFLKSVISSFKNHLRLVFYKVSSAICEGRQVGLLRATFPNNTISSSKTNLRVTGFRVISPFKNHLRLVCCKVFGANPLPAQAGYLREGYWHGTIFSSKTILRLLGRLIINVSGIFPKAVISPFKNHLWPVDCKVSRANPLPAQAGYLHEGYRINSICYPKTNLRRVSCGNQTMGICTFMTNLNVRAALSFFKKHLRVMCFKYCLISFFKNCLRAAFYIGGQTNLAYGAFANNIVSFFQIHSSNILKSEGL